MYVKEYTTVISVSCNSFNMHLQPPTCCYKTVYT